MAQDRNLARIAERLHTEAEGAILHKLQELEDYGVQFSITISVKKKMPDVDKPLRTHIIEGDSLWLQQ